MAVSRANTVTAEVGSAANSYEILAKLATGGMAEIFLARGVAAAGVERYVVLKRVLRHRASDANFMRMFLDEARLAAQLQHPNIAQVYDIGKLGDSYFFTMEYVHGETVRALLQRSHALRRQIPIGSILTIIAGAAAGLHHAHERNGLDGKPLGIVHRDVSPSNLMVSYEGTVKVVDFGVAKAEHRDTETRSGTVKGKITYMSPEQCRGNEIDRRSDLFSLGIVMWEMLTTERLFRRNSDFENMQAIVTEDVALPSSRRPDIPPEIDEIVMRLLAKSPDDRFQTADELHEAIEAAAVKTGSALSASSLGRFVRELFGQRPEPWIELQSHETHPEAVTVTSEPLAASFGMSPADELDAKLNQVPQLSERMTAQQLPSQRPTRQGSVRVETEPPSDQALDAATLRGLPSASAGAPPGAPSGAPAVPAGGVLVQTLPLTPSSALQLPAVTPSNAPQYPVLQSSGSHSYAHSIASAYTQQPAARRRALALAIIAPAVILGTIIGLVLGFGGDDEPAASVAGTDGAGGSATATATIAMETERSAPPAGTAAVAAGSAEPGTRDAGEALAAGDEEKDADPEEASEPDDRPAASDDRRAKTRPPRSRTHKADDVATLFAKGRFADAASACAASSRVLAGNALACTVSACKAKQTARAKRWFSSVAEAKRPSVIESCAGWVALEPAKPVDICKQDPLACQH